MAKTQPILVLAVDDEPSLLELLHEDLPQYHIEVVTCDTCAKARLFLQKHPFQAVLLDFHLPDGTGADLLQTIRNEYSKLPVLFITSHPDVDQAVRLMKEGAADYILKPFSMPDVAHRIHKSVEINRLQSEVLYHRQHQQAAQPSHLLIGHSEAIKKVQASIIEIAKSPMTPVLITGETGTGKEVVAHRIHQETHHDHHPLVEVDCTTLPRELFESELFGHEKGSFTGAAQTKVGLFEYAAHGSIFLDEIGEIPVEQQSRLLRALESHQFRRVGGTRPIPFEARVIAATNRNLQEMVQHQTFRSDLYYRLAVYQIHVPPLRERREDIPELAKHFCQLATSRMGKVLLPLSTSFLDKLNRHAFPGNIRELRNLIEQAVIQSNGKEIDFNFTPVDFVPSPSAQPPENRSLPLQSTPAPATQTKTLFEQEKDAVVDALKKSQGNKSAAARLLGISRAALIRRVDKLQIQS